MNNQEVYNDMVSKKLAEFTRTPASDIEIALPMPRVFVSEGVSFLMECFQAEEVVKSIGYALITNVFTAGTLTLYWTYTRLLQDQKGTLKAFDYQTAYQFDPEASALFCQVASDTPLNLNKLEFVSESQDGDYVICLLSEDQSLHAEENCVMEPVTPPSVDEQLVPVFSEPVTDIPF